MAINRMTRTALEAEIEVDQKILEMDGATPDLVRDKLECICFIIDDAQLLENAGKEAAAGLSIAKFWIRRWLKKQKGA